MFGIGAGKERPNLEILSTFRAGNRGAVFRGRPNRNRIVLAERFGTTAKFDAETVSFDFVANPGDEAKSALIFRIKNRRGECRVGKKAPAGILGEHAPTFAVDSDAFLMNFPKRPRIENPSFGVRRNG